MENSFFSLLSVLHSVPQLIIIVAGIFYISKKQTPDSILITIGAVVSFLSHSLNSFLYQRMGDSILMITSAISLIANFMFAIGLFILVKNYIDGKQNQQDNEYY